ASWPESLPIIAEIEKSGEWVSSRDSGYNLNWLKALRKSGRLRQCGEDGQGDYQRIRVQFSKEDKRHFTVFFYRTESLQREYGPCQYDRDARRDRIARRWCNRFSSGEELRLGAALKLLGVSKKVLYHFTRNYCLYRDGGAPLNSALRPVGPNAKIRVWFASELKPLKKRMERAEAIEVYGFTLGETHSLTGIPRSKLQSETERN